MDYRGVLGEYSAVYTVQKSKFIATCANVGNSTDAADFIARISKRYNDATHNCYAYIANPEGTEMKFSDAGEPQGTAGLPILEVIRKKGLSRTAVVVTRYFGGIKLGTGGLNKAYSKATTDCLNGALIADFMLSDYFRIITDYQLKDRIARAIENDGGEVSDIIYRDSVEIVFAVPVKLTEYLMSKLDCATGAKAKPEKLYTKYYIYKRG
ncbi:MAG: IMPACT family protein [Christensenellales bacterium]|jgi:uncharacterized YigZ family protein